jgi:hypothetical protein
MSTESTDITYEFFGGPFNRRTIKSPDLPPQEIELADNTGRISVYDFVELWARQYSGGNNEIYAFYIARKSDRPAYPSGFGDFSGLE